MGKRGYVMDQVAELERKCTQLREALERLVEQYERDVPTRKRPLSGYGALTQARAALREDVGHDE